MRTSSVRRAVGGPIWISAVRARSGRRRGLVQQIGEFRHHIGKFPADRRQQVEAEQLVGGAVRQLDAPGGVEPDHAGRDARQHRLGEPPTFIDLAVGVHQLAALRGKLAGHPVEGA